MNKKLLLALTLMIALNQCQLSSCSSNEPNRATGAPAVKDYYNRQTDSLLQQLDELRDAANDRATPQDLREQFAACRFRYKKIEAIAEYYFQGLIQRVNGPALPDVKTEDGTVWPPHGFQVLEQILYDGYNEAKLHQLSAEILLLQTDLRYMRENMPYNGILASHARELIQHEFIRIGALGITGFDAPLSKLSLQEAVYSLTSIREIAEAYEGKQAGGKRQQLLAVAIRYLNTHTDFEDFDRLEFLRGYLMPLSDTYAQIAGYISGSDSLMLKPFVGTLNNLLRGEGFEADYYSGYAVAGGNEAKVALGQRLFGDTRLSRSGEISCASCHKPALYFTDGLAKAGDFVHGGSLPRNTPTLYYAALQSHQFYDLRSTSLEDQADEVMKGGSEFNFSSADIAKKIWSDSSYAALFRHAFSLKADSLSGYEVRNALAAYVRSLSPFSSAFDAYMRGESSTLSKEQIKGFNLYAGKAKCASCHFIPLFNGNIPPWFTRSESEIIGVPAAAIWQSTSIDPDPGRFKIHPFPELRFAFKTPGLRNVAKTAPYMHNGVYRTLEEVIEFYHRGGGKGLGMDLPSQTLPFDSLALNDGEKKAIASFLESLTDNIPAARQR